MNNELLKLAYTMLEHLVCLYEKNDIPEDVFCNHAIKKIVLIKLSLQREEPFENQLAFENLLRKCDDLISNGSYDVAV